MKSLNICFEYLLRNEDIIYFDELVDRKRYPWVRSLIDKLSREWFIDNEKDITIYKGISLGKVLSYEMFNSNINLIVYILMIFSTKPKHINIFKTKKLELDTVYIEILEKLEIDYNINIVNEFCPHELVKMSESSYEGKMKYILRNSIIFFNNFIKNIKNTPKCYFQGYSNTLGLIDNFDNKIVVDQLPKKLKNIFSPHKPLYFFPKTIKKEYEYYNLKIDNNSDEYGIVKEIFNRHYINVKEEVQLIIDSVIKNFKKLSITKAILMHPEGRMASIIKQYLSMVGGEVALYNHGVVVYTHQVKELDNIHTALSWCEYETNFYNSIKKRVIKVGYPRFIDIKRNKNEITRKNTVEDSNVLILALIPDERYDYTRSKIIETNKDLIKMLLEIGFKKKNIYFKIHPGRANIEFYKEVYKKELLSKNILKDISIIDAINLSDLIIGGASTVIYEASFLYKPYYTYESEPDVLLPHEKLIFHEDYINAVTTLNKLKENILNKKSQDIDAFIENALYMNNYNSAKEVIYKEFLDKN